MNKDNPCLGCNGKCCKYVAVGFDSPDNRKDFDEILWFVAHENVHVFVDHEGDWYVQFSTPCSYLEEDGRCKIYEERFGICKDHKPEECVEHGEGNSELLSFHTIEEIKEYMDKYYPKK